MHMADALLSPVVGGTLIASTAGIAAFCVKKIKSDMDNIKIPLMGVMGAFIFAAQMINFSIPGTGSSGHIGGGMLLSIILGPFAGFLTMACVLIIQAMFFGDGGLLALGANIFNLGLFTCFIAYPLIYRNITKKGLTNKNIFLASIISAVVALQLGAFSVVVETVVSGRTELDFVSFILMMQPIHLAIGAIEGLLTASIVSFVWKARPSILQDFDIKDRASARSSKKLIFVVLILSVIIAGGLSIFASSNPDGLEWALEKVSAKTKDNVNDDIHKVALDIQSKTSIFPEYEISSKIINSLGSIWGKSIDGDKKLEISGSVAGIIGGLVTMLSVVFIGFLIKLRNKRRRA